MQEAIKSEKDKIGTDWIARMASDWEESAQSLKKLEVVLFK